MYTRTFYTDYCITYKSHVGVASSIHIKNNMLLVKNFYLVLKQWKQFRILTITVQNPHKFKCLKNDPLTSLIV